MTETASGEAQSRPDPFATPGSGSLAKGVIVADFSELGQDAVAQYTSRGLTTFFDKMEE